MKRVPGHVCGGFDLTLPAECRPPCMCKPCELLLHTQRGVGGARRGRRGRRGRTGARSREPRAGASRTGEPRPHLRARRRRGGGLCPLSCVLPQTSALSPVSAAAHLLGSTCPSRCASRPAIRSHEEGTELVGSEEQLSVRHQLEDEGGHG